MTQQRNGSGKRRRTELFRYEVGDALEARQVLRDAQVAAARAPEDADLKQRAAAARTALRACYGTVTVQAIEPAAWAALRQELAESASVYAKAVQKATEADQPLPAPPVSTWDAESVEVRLLAACDADKTHTADWWAAEFDGPDWSEAERDQLIGLCFKANSDSAQIDLAVLGKD